MNWTIRPFTHADIEFGLTQTLREGWNSTEEFFRAWLEHDPDGAFIAQAGEQTVGLVTTTRYARTGWIGNLIVVPERRSQGIGRALMTRAMAHVAGSGVRTIQLEADPPGVPLYRSLGFVDEFESLRFQRAPQRPAGGQAVKPVAPANLSALADFDAGEFGDDRGRMLALLHRMAKDAYWLCKAGRPCGYAFVLPSRCGVRLGPWVADSVQVAETLLQAVLRDWGDQMIVLGCPSPNRDAAVLLAAHGVQQTPSCLRMVYGEPTGAGHPVHVYGIGNGAMG